MARKGQKAARSAAKTDRQASPLKAPLTVSRTELLVDGTDRDFRALVHGLLTFQTLHAAIRDGHAALLNLGGPQYTILLCIRTLSDAGSVNVRSVAERLRLSGSFVTAETSVLEQRGLVCKERGVEDRRMVSLSLTAKGVALLDSIAALRQQVNDAEFGCLTRGEFQMLVPLVEQLVQCAERALALQKYLRSHGGAPPTTAAPRTPIREVA